MVSTSLFGFVLLGTSVAGVIYYRPRFALRRLLNEVFELAKIEVKKGEKVFRPSVTKMQKVDYGFDVTIQLPKGYSTDKFRDKLQTIAEATASKINMRYVRGRTVLLRMGMQTVDKFMEYDDTFVRPGELAIPYHTAFGIQWVDFSNEACCHLIVAGATRMGKSAFLRLLFTQLILSTSGNVRFFYINNKIDDARPFLGVRQIPQPAETIGAAKEVLNAVFAEIQARKEKLRLVRDCVNAAQYRAKHSNDPMPPIFVVFDEYGRFAEDEPFQELVQELAETAGYLDIHLVIATQRPDATTVLKPRIRANILARVCFQTADEVNSNMVVHTGEAAHLDSIQGRAVVLDGNATVGQVPYVSEEQAFELLARYRGEVDVEPTRPLDTQSTSTLPRFVTRPVRDSDVFGSFSTSGDREPDYEATRPRRSRDHRKASKR